MTSRSKRQTNREVRGFTGVRGWRGKWAEWGWRGKWAGGGGGSGRGVEHPHTCGPEGDGEDGGEAGCTGQQHGAAVKPLPAQSVQQQPGGRVAQQFHRVGQQEVDPHTALQVGHVQTEPEVRHGHHTPVETVRYAKTLVETVRYAKTPVETVQYNTPVETVRYDNTPVETVRYVPQGSVLAPIFFVLYTMPLRYHS